MSWPKWMSPPRREESETWCAKHQVQKTWMITSGFCPQCEKEQHGDKGTIASQLPNEDEHIDLEITVPDFKIIKHCIDCFLNVKHPMDLAKCKPLVYGLYHECACQLSNHKWNDITEFYQCIKCWGYNREINKS